jgi:hypothetical protein
MIKATQKISKIQSLILEQIKDLSAVQLNTITGRPGLLALNM